MSGFARRNTKKAEASQHEKAKPCRIQPFLLYSRIFSYLLSDCFCGFYSVIFFYLSRISRCCTIQGSLCGCHTGCHNKVTGCIGCCMNLVNNSVNTCYKTNNFNRNCLKNSIFNLTESSSYK